MKNINPIKTLFLDSSPRMPMSSVPYRKKFEYFSRYFNGSIITPVHGPRHLEVKEIGGFNYHPFLYSFGNSFLRNLKSFFKIGSKTLQLYFFKKEKYKVVISPNPLFTGLTAIFLGRLIRAQVVIEVNGNFESAFRYGDLGESDSAKWDRFKEKLSRSLIGFVLKRANKVKLVYPGQLRNLNLKNEKYFKIAAFPNFVFMKDFLKAKKKDEKYILSLGHPWYLKGMDILVRAFNIVSPDFPEYKLKIVGWCPEGREYYKNLAENNPKVEFSDPVHYEDVLRLMTQCSIFVLASRTESMGRVLLEAMASEKPIIASCVDGIPLIIKDRYNGLLFEKENYRELSSQIIQLLKKPELAKELAWNAYNYVQNELSEETYASNYHKMIVDMLTSHSGKPAIQYHTPVL